MKRETKQFSLSNGGKVLEIKTYLTGREMNELKKDMFEAVKVDMTKAAEGANAVKDVPATFMLDRERKLIELAVVSFDGSAENLGERLLDLPNKEYQEVLAHINETIQPDFQMTK